MVGAEGTASSLFVDARSTPARCAAVLFANGRCVYMDEQPSEKLMANFEKRDDGQRMFTGGDGPGARRQDRDCLQ